MKRPEIDIAILGGGLAGGLIALALAKLRPELRVLVMEETIHFGGNHIWSFFSSDVDPEDRWLTDPLVAAWWDGYEVRFPGHARRLSTPYTSATSERLDAAVREALPADMLLTGLTVDAATPTSVTVGDIVLDVGGVIDARGSENGLRYMTGGWQKFVGCMVKLEAPHELDRPILMDATVPQDDGYRFVYCLPFSYDEVFIEDTYYSDTPDLDRATIAGRIEAYAAQQGWRIADLTREESGVLPVIGGGHFPTFWTAGGQIARAGTRAALVHPLTSYSLPDAVRFAMHVAKLDDVSGASLAEASYAWSRAHWRQGRFYRMLARMLFGAAPPAGRYKLLERFYRLPSPLIERFYAGRSTKLDKLRILCGKPPVPLGAALSAMRGKGRRLASLERPA